MEFPSAKFSRPKTCFRMLAVFILAGITFHILAHKIDYTRVIYKRLKAPDPYTYERVEPAILAIDPSTKINKKLISNSPRIRDSLITTLWGRDGFPENLLPHNVANTGHPNILGRLPPTTKVHQMTLEMDLGLWSTTFYLVGSSQSDRLVVYHNGFGDSTRSLGSLFRSLINNGFDLVVVNPLGHGGNRAYAFPKENSEEEANIFHQMSVFDRPYRYHLNPVFASLNHVLAQKTYKSIDIIGFSMGAYLAIVVAAVDPRIERSYPIAGAYPAYLRTRNEIMPDGPPSHTPMLKVASSLDLFVLGAAGPNRKQVQIYNRFDRCCFNGLRGTTYKAIVEQTVKEIGTGGSFSVILDESHADHRISKRIVKFLLKDLERK